MSIFKCIVFNYLPMEYESQAVCYATLIVSCASEASEAKNITLLYVVTSHCLTHATSKLFAWHLRPIHANVYVISTSLLPPPQQAPTDLGSPWLLNLLPATL